MLKARTTDRDNQDRLIDSTVRPHQQAASGKAGPGIRRRDVPEADGPPRSLCSSMASRAARSGLSGSAPRRPDRAARRAARAAAPASRQGAADGFGRPPGRHHRRPARRRQRGRHAARRTGRRRRPADKAFAANARRAVMGADAVIPSNRIRTVPSPTTPLSARIAPGSSAVSTAARPSAASPPRDQRRTNDLHGLALLAAATIWMT